MVQRDESPPPRLIEQIAALALEVATVGDEYDFDDEWTVLNSVESIDDLWMMEGFAEALNRATWRIVKRIQAMILEDIQDHDGAAIVLGDFLYRPGRTGKPKVDPSLMDWLGEDAKLAFNPNNVRKTSVEAIAKARGQDPKAVIDTFFRYEEEDGERVEELVKVHRSKWPKYAAAMKHGERRAPTSTGRKDHD